MERGEMGGKGREGEEVGRDKREGEGGEGRQGGEERERGGGRHHEEIPTKWCVHEGGCDQEPHDCSVQDEKDVVPACEEPEEEEREGHCHTQQDRADHHHWRGSRCVSV